MRVHAYSAGTPAAITHPDVLPDVPLATLITIEADEHVYRVGDDIEIDSDLTVDELFGSAPGHVVVHHCHKIAVMVSYVGAQREIDVHPSMHVKAVRSRAVAAFGLDPATSADLVLRLSGSSDDLAPNSPIGAFVAKGSCGLQLDLVHLVRPQG